MKFIKINNYLINSIYRICKRLINIQKNKIRLINNNSIFFDCACNNLVLIFENKDILKRIKSKLERYGIYSYQRKYDLGWIGDEKKYQGIKNQSEEIFDKVLFISIDNIFRFKGIIKMFTKIIITKLK